MTIGKDNCRYILKPRNTVGVHGSFDLMLNYRCLGVVQTHTSQVPVSNHMIVCVVRAVAYNSAAGGEIHYFFERQTPTSFVFLRTPPWLLPLSTHLKTDVPLLQLTLNYVTACMALQLQFSRLFVSAYPVSFVVCATYHCFLGNPGR